eukprot:scaffold8059_cov315-Pinguiococcus_pyrenoidosus.AAC.7
MALLQRRKNPGAPNRKSTAELRKNSAPNADSTAAGALASGGACDTAAPLLAFLLCRSSLMKGSKGMHHERGQSGVSKEIPARRRAKAE